MSRAFFLCDLGGATVPLLHVWEHTVGSCHAALALRADWQAQLRQCHEELGFERVRFHGLLCDDVGAVAQGARGLFYSFFNVERIWDSVLSMGMRPFVELSFMPSLLASGKATVFHYKANVTPPTDVKEWAKLIRRLARHAVDRYGPAEVSKWNFEVWNEPNLKAFWRGSQKAYFDFYAATARALKRVDAALRVGGPATSENQWLEEFLEFCHRKKLPPDFVSTHYYPTDPTHALFEETEEQLAAARRGILRERAGSARALVGELPLYYTEWNSSASQRDPLHDEPYAAAFIIKTLMEVHGLVDAYSFWTFSDIFEERYFPSVPFHGGFGLLTLHGIAKPAYRAFELLHRFGSELVVPVDGIHPTVNCWVARDGSRTNVMLTNHAVPRQDIENVTVRVRLDGAPIPQTVSLTRIDNGHANPKRAWIEMGSPQYLSDERVALLHDASALSRERLDVSFESGGGAVSCELDIPAHGVALVTIE
jgi:xylan 1,4-beta-xylosidase